MPTIDDVAGPTSSLRTDTDGLAAVLEALGQRQFDLYTLSESDWSAMSPGQRTALINHQNRSLLQDHSLGPSYLLAPALERAVDRARTLYVDMTPEQRRHTLHPKHLDAWLDDRRVITIVAKDLDVGPLPDFLLPDSHRIPDTGPTPQWPRPVCLSVAINLDAPLQRVLASIEDLVRALHPSAARRSRRGMSLRPMREKYDDDDVAKIIEWYYRRAVGEPLKLLVAEAAGPKARHVDATRTKILRQLRWFRREFGIS